MQSGQKSARQPRLLHDAASMPAHDVPPVAPAPAVPALPDCPPDEPPPCPPVEPPSPGSIGLRPPHSTTPLSATNARTRILGEAFMALTISKGHTTVIYAKYRSESAKRRLWIGPRLKFLTCASTFFPYGGGHVIAHVPSAVLY
jgi:hypothetical protein